MPLCCVAPQLIANVSLGLGGSEHYIRRLSTRIVLESCSSAAVRVRRLLERWEAEGSMCGRCIEEDLPRHRTSFRDRRCTQILMYRLSQNATGLDLSIPMPGHPIPPASVEQTKKDVETLEKLFDDHDAIFLLMDSRESRWLPTVLGAAKGKVRIVQNLIFHTLTNEIDRDERRSRI